MAETGTPRVAATLIAGMVAALAVWAWNVWQGPTGAWELIEPINGTVVALVAWIAGPLLRKYERWASNGKVTAYQLAQAAEAGAQAAIDKLRKESQS